MKLTWLVLVLAPAAAAVWALAPLSAAPRSGELPAPAPPAAAAPPALAALDTAAFRAPLWVAATPPPPPPPAPPPPPPIRVQLLAVVREGDGYRAVLYDADADEVLIVGDGEAIRDGTVERVTGRGVEIRSAAGLRTLALRPDQGGSP